METTEKGESFLFVNNDVQNVWFKIILTTVANIDELIFFMGYNRNL